MKSLMGIRHTTKFKDLIVVVDDVLFYWIRSDVDYSDIWILYLEYP